MLSFLLFTTVALVAYGQSLVSTTTFTPDGCNEARKSKAGDQLKMHYTGSIDQSSATGTKGKVFDSSLKRGDPFDFTLGRGQVIKGWDQGLLNMCVGEKRTLIIPPALGYGANGAGQDIPGGATLKFEVECLDVSDSGPGGAQPPRPNLFKEIDINNDKQLSMEEMLKWFTDKRGMDKLPDGLWENEDKNKDNVVSFDEFSGPKGDVDEL